MGHDRQKGGKILKWGEPSGDLGKKELSKEERYQAVWAARSNGRGFLNENKCGKSKNQRYLTMGQTLVD